MAVVVNSDASTFKRTANLPAGTACSMWGWFRATTDRNTFTGFLAINSAVDALNWVSIGTTSDGTTVELTDGNGSGSSLSASMLSISLNTWYFFAFTTSGTAANATSAYWRTLTSNALSSATITGASSRSTTVGAMEFGRDGFTGEYLNGEMHAIGCTDAVLSADELLELSYFHEPQLDGIRSLNVFYPCIESVNTNASVDRSGNGRNATATVGSLVDPPALLWRAPPPIVPMAAAAGDVSVALTGQGATSSAGTVVPDISLALTGQALTAAAGTLIPALSLALTGQALAGSLGALVPVTAVSLTGSQATFGQGTVSPDGDVTVALTGQALSFAQGTLTPNLSIGISGQALTGAFGTTVPALDITQTGQSIVSAQGTITFVGDLTIALTGQALMIGQGALQASGGDTSFTGAGRKRRRKRFVVEIDGQDFEVSGPEEAIELLSRAKDLAIVQIEKAQQASVRVKPGIRRPSIRTKTPELKQIVAQARQQIVDQYDAAIRDFEIRAFMAKAEEAEEEAIVHLLM